MRITDVNCSAPTPNYNIARVDAVGPNMASGGGPGWQSIRPFAQLTGANRLPNGVTETVSPAHALNSELPAA